MIRYKVERKCSGFLGRVWEAGQIVDLDDDASPPRHFVKQEEFPGVKAPYIKPSEHPGFVRPESIHAHDEQVALSQLAKNQTKPTGGMNSLPPPVDITTGRR